MNSQIDDETATSLALSEAASAAVAARMAGEAADQAAALPNDLEIAGAWAQIARSLAGVCLGHSHRARQYAPGSQAARAAGESCAVARTHARAAEQAARRD